MIKAAIPDADGRDRDLAGDGDHYAATVISAAFKGKSRVQQHQMVYAALQGPHGRRAACAGADDERAAGLASRRSMDAATLYHDDIVAWAEQQAAALRELAGRPELSNAVDGKSH